MTDSMPSVSVVVLTHNRLPLLRDAVRTLLEQDYPQDRIEIIVVNDGSLGGTREWLDEQAAVHDRIRPVHQAALGIPTARNAGIRVASGDLIAIVADDYLLAPDYVATFVRFFRERPEALIVRFGIIPSDRWPGSLLSHFYYQVSFQKRLQPRTWQEGASRFEKLRTYFARLPKAADEITTNHQLEAAGAAAYRREVFDRIGMFDESLKRTEDTDMAIRLRKMGILIYYNPFHKIRHRYGRWGGDTLKKSFESGIYAARLHAKLGKQKDGAPRKTEGPLHRVLSLIWRVRQAANPLTGLLLLPGLALFECAWQLGYTLGRRRERDRI